MYFREALLTLSTALLISNSAFARIPTGSCGTDLNSPDGQEVQHWSSEDCKTIYVLPTFLPRVELTNVSVNENAKYCSRASDLLKNINELSTQVIVLTSRINELATKLRETSAEDVATRKELSRLIEEISEQAKILSGVQNNAFNEYASMVVKEGAVVDVTYGGLTAVNNYAVRVREANPLLVKQGISIVRAPINSMIISIAEVQQPDLASLPAVLKNELRAPKTNSFGSYVLGEEATGQITFSLSGICRGYTDSISRENLENAVLTTSTANVAVTTSLVDTFGGTIRAAMTYKVD